MITKPKTPKSIRVITLPDFLVEEFQEYCSHLYGIMKHERLFRFTKSYMEHCMVNGIGISGVKRIRLHDLRHSHASMLVDMGVVSTAKKEGKHKIALLMETICATGIRVSEVSYITVEAVCRGQAEIVLKGKIRIIIIPSKLRKKLLSYIKHNQIKSGKVFLTERGNRISRGQIWKEMKQLSCKAKVEASKVFPHNLRHLFAVTFYNVCKDVVRLADVLGLLDGELRETQTTDYFSKHRRSDCAVRELTAR